MKVLVISHNCFSTTQNMGKTLLSLFKEFNKEELMQLYLYPSIPNVDVCESYFRITDKDALRSVFKRKKCGQPIEAQVTNDANALFESAEDEKQYKSINRNSLFIRRFRDFMWKISAWKNADLKKWLCEGKPDVVFFALGNAVFSQNIAKWLAKYLNIPLVTYVCDEYYFYYKGILSRGLTSSIAKTLRTSDRLITICEELGEVYHKAFGSLYTTIMTGSSFEPGSLEEKTNASKQLSYIGNLGLNRWKSLIDIADVLNELNSENSWDYNLVYYGSENVNLKGKVKYGGRLNPSGVKKVMSESLMLIHTETFDEEYSARLRYSVSTKIADSLASGTCLLAYGPPQFASMQHLTKNECVCFAMDKNELKQKLKLFFENMDEMKMKQKKAIETAKCFHNSRENSSLLYRTLEKLIRQ